ncbi:DUF2576 domain-containing protein [Microbacterium sp. Ag1]|uniref:DUF2576 domain-containing protein n=1 Tax=Microbacterium sp. Ag1 TaxID=1643443 RepID=UPI000629149E|nr:DUF2576 domain-containing protein [Microbacterium sp. Ag1]KKX97198.1 hypothetical protein AAY78_14570 [Microbacterium sp. Ag1]
MQIQFDPFAFAVAIAAFAVAWRAHYLAKTAPELARRRDIRDQIRKELESLRRSTTDLSTILQLGKPLTAPPTGFDGTIEEFSALAQRVPEAARLGRIEAKVSGLSIKWESAFHDEYMSAMAKQSVVDWQQHVANADSRGDEERSSEAREILSKNLSDQERYRRAEDASRTRVRELLKDFKDESDSYINWLDSLDRGKAKA